MENLSSLLNALVAYTGHSSRPQPPPQPPSPPIASLPSETLRHILACSLEGLEPFEAQAARLAFGRVARLWWEVAEVRKSAAVVTEQQAAGLVKAFAEGRERPLQLNLVIPGSSDLELQQAFVDLLGACRQLQSFSSRVRFESGSTATFGDASWSHLRGMSTLTSFALPSFKVYAHELLDLLSSWPLLDTLLLHGFTLRTPSAVNMDSCQLPALRTLAISFTPRFAHLSLVDALVQASQLSLNTLELDTAYHVGENEFALLLPIASRLRSIQLVDFAANKRSEYFLEPFLDRLDAVQHLDMGLNGYKVSELFARFGRLAHLRTIRLRSHPSDTMHPPAMDAVAYLQKPSKLGALTLPKALEEKGLWTAEEVQRVKDAAEETRVALRFE